MRLARIKIKNETINQEPVEINLLDPLIEKYKNKRGNLIPLLQGTQDIFGYIPHIAFKKLSEDTGIELSDMYGVATFYAQFRLNPVGKHIIKVCHGTACHVQNANSITDAIQEHLKINDGETTENGEFTLESVACLGCCSLAPVMMIGDETYGKLTGNQAVKIIKNIVKAESN
ncbi:MAG: NADH-quinone oxidoreductase subunit NuoE [Bacteroidales bacterium]|nr:NADH-quinone oxidoreductase subunit NuoE [Bacteroidales bacterium]